MQVVHFELVPEAEQSGIEVDAITLLQAIVEGFVRLVQIRGDAEDQIGEDG